MNKNIDPVCSINSGQDFSWEMINNTWYGVNGNRVLKITLKNQNKQDNFLHVNNINDIFEFESFPYERDWEKNYFRLDDNFAEIQRSFNNDCLILNLIKKYNGLRILRQDPVQCIFSFACASNNNIPRIRKIIKNLSKKFGERIMVDGIEFFTFPTSEKLQQATNDQLKECGVGYRYKTIKTIANKIVNRELDFTYLKNTGYGKAKKELLDIYGIGNKTADCVLLFSLEKLDAFPIDLWINRILNTYYSNLYQTCDKIKKTKIENNNKNNLIYDKQVRKINSNQYEKISNIARDYFGQYCGYAQQYLYYHIRNSMLRSW